MPEFLLELFSEEMPARMQPRAAEDFSTQVQRALAPLMAEPPRAFHGPRRLTLVGEMATRAETAPREERGPRVGAPEAALAGFLRKHGADRHQLVEQKGFFLLVVPGAAVEAPALITERLPGVLRAFPWPKSMRWGTETFAWVRPLRRILCVFDGAVVPWTLGAHGLVAGDATEGHRVHASGPFSVRSFGGYERGLRERRVVLDAAERAALIREGLDRLCVAEGLRVVPDEALLAEVAGLVEWPVPLLGRINDAFMDLPPEVMRATLRANQKLFTLVDATTGAAAPRFGLVANLEAEDGGAAIVAGNERVVRARLSDARFFWDQDRKQPLEAFLPKLDAVVFHEKLGTQGDRVRRLEQLAREIAPKIGADPELAARAARLCKADLATGMVGEFPELQGVMGRYYALASGEPAEVADAIGSHYRPLGVGDAVPTGPVSVAVAMADKLDLLAGFFAVGEQPTGSGDPFALRRAGLGLIRLMQNSAIRIALRPTLHRQLDVVDDQRDRIQAEAVVAAQERLQAASGVASSNVQMFVPSERRDEAVVAEELLDFLLDRLRVQLRAEGARHDILAAVFGATPDDDLVRLLARTEALRELLEGPDGPNLVAAYKRAANILRIEDKRDGPHAPATDPALLLAPRNARSPTRSTTPSPPPRA